MTEYENEWSSPLTENAAKAEAAAETAAENTAQAAETAADTTADAAQTVAEDLAAPAAEAAQAAAEAVPEPAAPAEPVRKAPEVEPPKAEQPKKKEKAPKKKSALKAVALTVVLALLFGTVAGGIFYLINRPILAQQAQQDPQGGARPSDEPKTGEPQSEGPGSGEPQSSEPGGSGESGKQTDAVIRSAKDVMEDALAQIGESLEGSLTVPEIAVIMAPSMVSVNCTGTKTISSLFGSQQYKTSSAGSGIIVGRNDTELLIVTNNHVIADADEIKVQFANSESNRAYVKGADANNDLAIIVVKLEEIKEETIDAIAYAELGDSDKLVIGETVVAVGNAMGLGQSVTAGIVSALNRTVKDENGNTAELIQTDAAINPGNSGGALVNLRGEVIGINSVKYADEAVEGMGFAIPISKALPILEELMLKQTRTVVDDPEKAAYLGLTLEEISSTAQSYYGMPSGLFVRNVTEGYAAAEAGIQKGDIITSFDGKAVTTRSELQKLLTYYEAGETVTVVIQRQEKGEYESIELQVTLSKRPADTKS